MAAWTKINLIPRPASLSPLCRSLGRSALQSQQLDRHFAQLVFLDLARHRHWKAIDKVPMARHLEAGQPFIAPLDQAFFDKRQPGAGADPGHDLFAVLAAWHPDDLRI